LHPNKHNKDVEMTDGSFTLVKYKQSPKLSKTLPIPSPTLLIPSGTSADQQSNNRDPFTELAQRRPVSPSLPEPTPKRPYFQRVTWRIDILKITESPEKSLREGINEIWSILKEADDKLLIYPWKACDLGKYKALSGPSNLPTTKEGINRYFPDAYFFGIWKNSRQRSPGTKTT
jgi:hypothetical protein